MTLKDIRLKLGLTQGEAAKYLGISSRSYQNYESDLSKADTPKYKSYCSKLQGYNVVVDDSSSASFNADVKFNTNVVIGDELKALLGIRLKNYKKRDCYTSLKRFIDGDYDGKICILYGLRRTGKTTLLFQSISELPLNKAAYIKVQTTDNMSSLTKDLKILFQMGYIYVFIDEITLLEDFIGTAAVLSDIFSLMGMKIVVSGTDSLGFAMANRDELYDRNIMIHTSFISFKEYARLLNIHSVDKYIEYGGTLKMENMSYDDPDFAFDDVSFRDDESTRKYIDTAISRNIQHTLKNNNNGEYFNQLRELYEVGELTNVINRIVERMNHTFLLSVVKERFKSHDLGSAKQLLLHNDSNVISNALYDIDQEKLLERLKALIDVKERHETKIMITEEHIEKVKKYLLMLDLIVDCPLRYESGKPEEYYIFVQSGMRYSIAKALVYSLMQDEYFKTISERDKEFIVEKILSDVKGKMLEDIVLLETFKALPKTKEVFKFKFDISGEFDMVIYDKVSHTCTIYEVKHSNKVDERQVIHLVDNEKCSIVEARFGKITGKYVLYTGKNKVVNDIQYLNVEQYLANL